MKSITKSFAGIFPVALSLRLALEIEIVPFVMKVEISVATKLASAVTVTTVFPEAVDATVNPSSAVTGVKKPANSASRLVITVESISELKVNTNVSPASIFATSLPLYVPPTVAVTEVEPKSSL